jgi:hypothetical protein
LKPIPVFPPTLGIDTVEAVTDALDASLTLPLHSHMGNEVVARICDEIRALFRR